MSTKQEIKAGAKVRVKPPWTCFRDWKTSWTYVPLLGTAWHLVKDKGGPIAVPADCVEPEEKP